MKKLNKILCLLCAAAMIVTLAACGGDKKKDSYTPGTYQGEAAGYGGTVTVEITVDSSSITAVTITGNDETPGVGQAAIPDLEDQIMKAQSADIDGVSGASGTSKGVKEALASALSQATK